MSSSGLQQSSSIGLSTADLLNKALESVQDLEVGGSSFFANINSAIEKQYEPNQAIADYNRLVEQVEALEATITKLGLANLPIPEGKSLEDILKECIIASSSAYQSASTIDARAKLAQKAIHDASNPEPS